MAGCAAVSMCVLSFRALCMAVLALPLCGCAVTKVGADGSREVVGFVHMKLPANSKLGALAGEAVELNVLGLLVFNSPVGGGVALGYSREQVTALRNNALVLRDPDCAASPNDRANDRAKECPN